MCKLECCPAVRTDSLVPQCMLHHQQHVIEKGCCQPGMWPVHCCAAVVGAATAARAADVAGSSLQHQHLELTASIGMDARSASLY